MTGSIKDYTPNYKFILPRFDLATWHDYIEQNFRSIDALFYNLFVVNQYKGMWEHSTIYNVGDVVFIGEDNNSASEGKLYKVLVQHTTPATGTFTEYKTENPTYYALYVESTTQIDSQLDVTSERPVQNSAITTAINSKANISDLSDVAFTGKYADLLNKPSLATVATSGSYNDLLNKPNMNDYALDNGVVHKVYAETVGGTKTFTSDPYIKNASAQLYFDDTQQTKGTAPSADVWSSVTFHDTNGNLMGRCRQLYANNKKNVVELQVYKANSSTDTTSATLGVVYPASGDPYGFAPNSDVIGSIITTLALTTNDDSKNGVKLGNGIKINWGKTSALNNNQNNPVSTNFKYAFETTKYTVLLLGSNGTSIHNEYGAYVISKNTGSFSAILRGTDGGNLGQICDYIAIGK